MLLRGKQWLRSKLHLPDCQVNVHENGSRHCYGLEWSPYAIVMGMGGGIVKPGAPVQDKSAQLLETNSLL